MPVNDCPNILEIDYLMHPCRSAKHIETLSPYLKFVHEDGHFECETCKNRLFTINNNKQKYVFKYDVSNGVDFTNTKRLPQLFRSLKQTLKKHINDSDLHSKASAWMEKREQGLRSQRRLASTAGLTLGRLAYSVLYRGRPYSDFTMNVLLAAKNGAVTGDINHSKRFVSEFRSTCAATPPIALSCDRETTQ